MHILEVAVATNILNRPRNPHERRSDDLDAAMPSLSAFGLARVVSCDRRVRALHRGAGVDG